MAEPSLGGLPSELYCEITAYLLLDGAVGSAAALAQCTRRLCQNTLPMLYDSVGRENLKAGQNGLIWAAENDEMGTLKALLESGVDPNARFWSALPDCVRQDVFAAQHLRRRLSPRLDGHLVAKMLQEDIVWYSKCIGAPESHESRFYRAWYLASINGDIPESLPLAWRAEHGVDELIRTARFGCRGNLDDLELLRCTYSWTALHVATKRGNTHAVEALLAHGADIEARSKGLCDCLGPLPIAPGHPERPPTCSALHIAACSGNEPLARLLLDRGANYLAVGEVDLGVHRVAGAPTRSITALHSAAWGGNITICQLLLDRHAAYGPNAVRDVLQREDARGLSALDYAIAAGNARTTGSWLLEHQHIADVSPLQRTDLHDDALTPLNSLCYWGQYRDARYLLDRIRCTPPGYCDALDLCFVRLLGNIPRFTNTRASLPQFLGQYMEAAVSEKPWLHEYDGEEALVCLVKQLLALGADPNSRLDPSTFPSPSDFGATRAMSALHLAATHGQRAAVEVFLDRGGLLELRCPMPSGRLGPTPLSAALVPPVKSPVSNNPRAYLETIITLLERGASFANTVPEDVELKTEPINWFVPLFENRSMTHTWYHAGLFDLFERIMELAARQQGEGHVPDEWAADLIYVAIMYGRSVASFCKWLVQRYSITPAQVLARDPNKLSLGDLIANDFCFRDPELLEWILDFAPQTAAEMALGQNSLHPALRYANRNALGCARVLVERGLANQMPEGDASGNTPQMLLEDRFRTLLFEACMRCQEDDAANLIDAVLTRAVSLQLDTSNLLVRNGEPAISRVIRFEGKRYTGESCHPKAERVLKVLLKHPVSLYGVKGRVHGERPSAGKHDASSPKKHQFVYPVPIAVDLGRADLLELIFKETAETAPPSPDDILEVLAMALDASKLEPDPAVVRAILENTTADASALIPRPIRTLDGKTDTTNRVPPLYHLLKTFYNAHISAPRRDIYYYTVVKSLSPKARAAHHCDCALVTRDAFLVDCVAVLLQHGASWRQPSEPSGETPLDVLAAILDDEDCLGEWPTHNLNTLRRHVKLDWRAAAGVVGEAVGEGFNPVEVRKLGVEASWG